MISNKKNILILISTFAMFAIFVGITLSFFSTRTIGNETAANINLTTAVEEVVFIDGPALNIDDITPGTIVEKTFRVESNSSDDFTYHIIFDSVQNGVSNNDDLNYSVTCTSYLDYESKIISGACGGKGITNVPNSKLSTDQITYEYNIIENGGNIIASNHTHEYTISFEVVEDLSPTTILSFNASFKLIAGTGQKSIFNDGYIVYFNPTSNQVCENYVVGNSVTENKVGCLKWYAFLDNTNNSTVSLLLDHNTTPRVEWSTTNYNDTGGDAVYAQLASDVSLWHQDIKVTAELLSAQDIADITGHPTFDETQSGQNSFYFENNADSCPQCSTLGKGNAEYAWLFDRTYICESYGCFDEAVGTYTAGYWTSSPRIGYDDMVWRVRYNGRLSDSKAYNDGDHGVRPVIEVSKLILQ